MITRRSLMVGGLSGVAGAYILLGLNGGNTAPMSLGAASAGESANLDTASVIEMAMGDENAPVTLIEYASYTCPHCATFHADVWPRLKEDFVDTGKVRFIYREVYFDQYGLWASAIARCAGPDRFFGVTDLLYKDQRNWLRAGDGEPQAIANALRDIGKVAGMSPEAIEGCLQDTQNLRTLVAWYQENAKEHGIRSTPSLVVNGTTHANLSYNRLSEILNDAGAS